MRWLAALALLALPALARAQCGADHSGCPQAAGTGTEPCNGDLTPVLESAARNALGSGGPTYRQIHNGCNRPHPPTLEKATIPCAIMKAIAQTESDWQQFCASCGNAGSTLISFDCGYGVMQVTSGMDGSGGFDPAQVAGSTTYNVGTGAKILLDKWAATPCVGDNVPEIAEDWYMAVWAYNSFGWVNNPNNPNFPASRPPYHGPGTLSRGSYPYQEIVLGYAQFPPVDGATPRWTGLPISLVDRGDVCGSNGSSCAQSADVPDPASTHCDECQRGNTATLVSVSPPSLQLAPGESGDVTFTLKNDGLATWQASAYHLVKSSLTTLGPATAPLPNDVAPGATVEIPVSFTADSAGTSTVTYALIENPCAFGPELSAQVVVVDRGTSTSGSSGTVGGSGSSGNVTKDPKNVNGSCGCASFDGGLAAFAALLAFARRRQGTTSST